MFIAFDFSPALLQDYIRPTFELTKYISKGLHDPERNFELFSHKKSRHPKINPLDSGPTILVFNLQK